MLTYASATWKHICQFTNKQDTYMFDDIEKENIRVKVMFRQYNQYDRHQGTKKGTTKQSQRNHKKQDISFETNRREQKQEEMKSHQTITRTSKRFTWHEIH